MEEKVIVEFTDAEISDVVSSIDNAPIDGYGNITKNRRVYSTPFKKLKRIANEKLAAILRKHYSLEDTIESFKESERLGFGLTLDVTLDSLSQLKITLKNEQQELSTKVVDLSFVQKCEQSAKEHADNAETAKEDAERAKSNAEKAKGDAETAKNAAEAAREAAEIFSATAQTHANNASTDATSAADSATTAQEAAKEAKIYAIRAEEVLENVGNFIPGELGEDGKFYPFDKDTGQVSASALAAPSAGVVYFDLFSNKLYTWDSATGSYILQADLNATGGSLDPSVLADYVKKTQFANYNEAGIVYTPSGDEPYTGVFAKNGIPMLMGSQKAGALSDAFFNNPQFYSAPILSKNLYRWIKVGLVQNTETLTDEEKASACEWVGAVKRNTVSSNGIYGKSGGVDILYHVSQWGAGGGEDAIARRTNKGGLRVVLDETNAKPEEMAAPRGWVEENFLPLVNYTTGQPGKAYILNSNGQAMMDIIPNEAKAWTLVQRGANGVIYCSEPEVDMQASNKRYTDALQKFTHYITIGTTDENNIINVSLRITNNSNESLAAEGAHDFSLLAQAISDTANGAVSASGTIQSGDVLTHLVLRAIYSNGNPLQLETCRLDDKSLEYIEISGESYVLIDNVI